MGLDDEVGNREFNPPSLRGVSRRDSSAARWPRRSLEEVFQKERHPRGLELTSREIADLVAFLKTLVTASSPMQFVVDRPRWSSNACRTRIWSASSKIVRNQMTCSQDTHASTCPDALEKVQ